MGSQSTANNARKYFSLQTILLAKYNSFIKYEQRVKKKICFHNFDFMYKPINIYVLPSFRLVFLKILVWFILSKKMCYFLSVIYNLCVRIDNSTFESVEEFKYLGTNLTNQNSIAEEIKSSLRIGIACCHSVQNILSCRLLSKNLKIKIYI